MTKKEWFEKYGKKGVSTPHQSPAVTASPQGEAKEKKNKYSSRRYAGSSLYKTGDNPSVSKADRSPYTGEPKKLSYIDKPGRTGAKKQTQNLLPTPKEKPEGTVSKENRRMAREHTLQVAVKNGRATGVSDLYADVLGKDAYEYYSQFSDADIKNAVKLLKDSSGYKGNTHIGNEISAAEQVLYDRSAARKQAENEKTAKSWEDKAKADPERLTKIYNAKAKESSGLDLLYYLKKAESTLKPGDADFDEKYKTLSGWETDSMNLLHLTDDERDTVYYLLGEGNEEAANSYIDSLNLKARRQEYESGVNKKYGKENPVIGTLKSSAHQYTAPGAFLATAAQDIKNKFTGNYDPVDTNSRLFRGARARGDLQSGVMERAEEAGGAWPTVASVGQGVSDFAFTLPLPTAARTAMYALSPAGSNTLDALERGANPHQATMYGAATGVANAATNYLPTEHALKVLKTGGNFLPSVLKQGVGEGLEGASQNVIENYLDEKIMGEKSQVSLLAKEYEKTGLSSEEALRKARNDIYLKGTLEAGAMEALGGAAIGGAMSGLGRVGARLRGDLPLPMPQFDEKIDFNDPNVGLVSDDYVANNLSKKVAESLDIVARALGVKVEFADSVDDGNANASQQGNKVLIEKFNNNPLEFLLGHEVTHYMQEVSPAEYDAFKMAALSEDSVNADISRLYKLYREKGKDIDHNGALDEAVANYAGKLINDTKVLDKFIAKHRTDRNMLQRVFDGIGKLIEKLPTVQKMRAKNAQSRLLAALEATVQNKNTAELGGESRQHKKTPSKELLTKLIEKIPILENENIVYTAEGDEFSSGDKKLSEQINEFFDEIGNSVHRDGFGDVVLDKKGVKASIAHGVGRAKAIAFASVPDVIKYGTQIDYEAKWKGRNYDSYVFAAPVNIKNRRGYVAVVVTKSDMDNRYYLHEIVDPEGNIVKIKKDDVSFKTKSETAKSNPLGETPPINSIYNSQEKSNTNLEESFDNEVSQPRQSLKGSEIAADAESKSVKSVKNVSDFAKKYIRNPLRWAYQRGVSGQAPLERLSKGQRKQNGDQSITAEDLVQQVRGAGGIVDAILEDGLYNIDGTQMEMGGERAPSWREMVERIPKGKEQAFNEYLQHRHNIDRLAQNKALLPDTSKTDSELRIKTLEVQNPEFKDLAEDFYAYWDLFMREWAVGSGLLSADTYERFRKIYPNYIPSFRVDNMPGAANVAMKGMKPGTKRVIKNAVGGVTEIMNIQDSFPIYIDKFIKNQRQNELYLNLAEWAKNNPAEAAKEGIILPGSQRKNETTETTLDIFNALYDIEKNALEPGLFGVHQVNAYKDGKKTTVQISDDVYKALDFLVNPKMGDIQKIARTITGLSKAAITQYNPIFVVTNMMKDFQTGYIHSNEWNPLKYTARVFEAGKEIAKNSERFREYKALGGARSGFYSRNDGFTKSYGKKYGVSDNKFKNAAKKVARDAGRIADVSEQSVRFAEYLNYLDKHGDTPENRKKAILAAADITTNFSRSGPAVKAADSITMYLNAGVQGVDKMRRQILNKKTAIPTLLKAGISNALMSAVIGSLIPVIFGATPNEENPHYKELTEYVKDNNYILPNIWNKDENGYPKTFFKIPKSREYGAIFGGAYNRIAGALTGDKEAFDERSMREWWNNIKNNVAPASPFTDSFPIAMRDIWVHNKDWAGNDIVPQSMQELSPKNQYDAGTSEISKAIAKMLPISPMKIDETVRAFGGSAYGEGALKIATKSQNTPLQTVADIFLSPIKSKFNADPLYSSKSISKFYDDKAVATTAADDRNAEELLASDIVTPEEKRVSYYNKVSKEMADLMTEERRLLANMPNTPERKAKIDELRAQRIELARGAAASSEEAYKEWDKTYIPEISMLSEKDQLAARQMNYKYKIPYDEFIAYTDTLSYVTENGKRNAEKTKEKYMAMLPIPVQAFVKSTKKEESAADLRRYAMLYEKNQYSPEAMQKFDEVLSGDKLKNPVDYSSEESFYYSLLTDAKKKRYSAAKARFKLSTKDYYRLVDAVSGCKKKADKLAALRRIGLTASQAEAFYNVVLKP